MQRNGERFDGILADNQLGPRFEGSRTPTHAAEVERFTQRARDIIASAVPKFGGLSGIFVAVILVLVAIDAATGPDWWVQWPFLGWGVGLLAHAYGVFCGSPDLLANWEARKVAAEKRRLDEASAKGPLE